MSDPDHRIGLAFPCPPESGANRMKRLALPVFLGLFSFLGGLAGMLLLFRGVPTAQAEPSNPAYANNDINRLGERFEWVARKLSSSVVALEAVKPPAVGKTKNVEESGSGVLVRIPGQRGIYVLTNNHVIAGAEARKITVSLADNRLVKPAQVWADPESDIAVLRLEAEGLSPAELGDSDRVHVGQWVLAYGSPFGLNQTVTHGIISAASAARSVSATRFGSKTFCKPTPPSIPVRVVGRC